MKTPLVLLAWTLTGCATAAPRTVVRNVVDLHHGTEVHDPYRWLEDGASDEVKAWSAAQTRHARAYLDALPGREALEKIAAVAKLKRHRPRRIVRVSSRDRITNAQNANRVVSRRLSRK
jgi:prolyl oligopeptidase PreP (S9A serine peptidase family)